MLGRYFHRALESPLGGWGNCQKRQGVRTLRLEGSPTEVRPMDLARANEIEATQGCSLTQEEALSLLTLCLMSPIALDAQSARAVQKLADYCRSMGRLEDAKAAAEATKRLKRASSQPPVE